MLKATLLPSYLMFLVKGRCNWEADNIKVALLVNYNYGGECFFEDVSKFETIGKGYIAGGETLQNKSVLLAGNTVSVTASPTIWTRCSITACCAIIYNDTDPAKPIIGYVPFEEEEKTKNGNFMLEWNAIGIFSLGLPNYE